MNTPSSPDALTEVLHALRLRGGVFVEAEIGAPWSVFSKVGPEDCVAFSPAPREVIAYHFVCEGDMLLRVEGEAGSASRARAKGRPRGSSAATWGTTTSTTRSSTPCPGCCTSA